MLHIEGEARGGCPVTVLLKERVVPAAAEYWFPDARGEALEDYPGVVVKAPDLSEVDGDRSP
jgi:hypothetical protein